MGWAALPLVQEAGWNPEPVWTGAQNLALTGFQTPDRPARSDFLYRLRYPFPNRGGSLRVKTHIQRGGAERPAACDLIRAKNAVFLFPLF
jgi:hypothetical protein